MLGDMLVPRIREVRKIENRDIKGCTVLTSQMFFFFSVPEVTASTTESPNSE